MSVEFRALLEETEKELDKLSAIEKLEFVSDLRQRLLNKAVELIEEKEKQLDSARELLKQIDKDKDNYVSAQSELIRVMRIVGEIKKVVE